MDRNFSRLLDTLAVLQRTQKLTTTEIKDRLAARGHQVTPRTVQRDLEGLAKVYPLDCDDRSKPYGWSWRPSAARLSAPGMDWPEAISFYLLATYLGGVIPGSVNEGIQLYVDEAKRKLSQHFDQLPLRRWPERVRVVQPGPPGTPPSIRRAVHLVLTEAVLLGRRVKLRYRPFDKELAKSYTVSPLGLIQYGAVLYLPVRFDGHEDVRTIAMHRVERAELLDEPSGIESFDLSAWIDTGALGFGGNETIDMMLRFYGGTGALLIETPFAKGQVVTQEPNDQHMVKVTVRDTVQLRRWLLSQGRNLTVLAPLSLRDWISSEHSAALAGYK